MLQPSPISTWIWIWISVDATRPEAKSGSVRMLFNRAESGSVHMLLDATQPSWIWINVNATRPEPNLNQCGCYSRPNLDQCGWLVPMLLNWAEFGSVHMLLGLSQIWINTNQPSRIWIDANAIQCEPNLDQCSKCYSLWAESGSMQMISRDATQLSRIWISAYATWPEPNLDQWIRIKTWINADATQPNLNLDECHVAPFQESNEFFRSFSTPLRVKVTSLTSLGFFHFKSKCGLFFSYNSIRIWID